MNWHAPSKRCVMPTVRWARRNVRARRPRRQSCLHEQSSSGSSEPRISRLSGNPTVYGVDVDFSVMDFSGSGTPSAEITPVDLLLPPTCGSTSGCEAGDFVGFPAGNIALIQRGTCTFQLKAENAQAAGASGVIVFNEGNAPDRVDLLFGTLGEPTVTIPILGVSFALGNELDTLTLSGPVTVRIETTTISEVRQTKNVLAETERGREGTVVMVGAHLDSVLEGPGINDNGSGSRRFSRSRSKWQVPGRATKSGSPSGERRRAVSSARTSTSHRCDRAN
jgi:PA domain-containing protein/peptidase M28-like protein